MTSLQTAATSYNRALLNFFPYSFIIAIKNVSLKHKSMHSIEVMPHQGSSNKAAKAFQGWQQQKTRNISIATFSLQQSQAAIHSRFRIVHRMENTQLSRWSFEDVWDSPREDTRTVKHRLKYSKCRMRASSATVYTKKLWTQFPPPSAFVVFELIVKGKVNQAKELIWLDNNLGKWELG